MSGQRLTGNPNSNTRAAVSSAISCYLATDVANIFVVSDPLKVHRFFVGSIDPRCDQVIIFQEFSSSEI